MIIKDLPEELMALLINLNAPERLHKHSRIVYSTAAELLQKLKDKWPALELDEELILFGAATHDIGKCVVPEELNESGKLHEAAGLKLLMDQGYPQEKVKFCITHGAWPSENLYIDDLFVILSDKIWKGTRIYQLEEMIALKLYTLLKIDFWDIHAVLDEIITEITLEADKKLSWQALD